MKKYNAFVLMPFDKSFDDIYKIGIQETAHQCDVYASRLDEQLFDSNMVSEIYNQIDKADFIIADMTGRNANVFYEVGYAHARKKIVLLLTQNKSDIPFDFLQRPHIIYDGKIKILRDELTKRIEWSKTEIEKRKKDKIDISFDIINSEIQRSEYSDIAVVNYKLEISNFSDEAINDIQFLDIYTGSNWDFYLDDKRIKSEIRNKTQKRHRLIPEIKMIPSKDHIQIELVGKKTVAYAWKQDEIKDSYRLSGYVGIELFISSDSIKKQINLNHECKYLSFPEDMPF